MSILDKVVCISTFTLLIFSFVVRAEHSTNSTFCSNHGVSLDDILLSADLSAYVYEHRGDIPDPLRLEWATSEQIWDITAKRGETFGRVWLFSDRRLFVVFRGTASFTDGFVNSRFTRVPIRNLVGEVHCGFNARYDLVKSRLTEIIRLNSHRFNKIIFTGHSLGGAVAALAAFRHAYSNPRSDINLITFGAPRIGNLAFGKYFNLYVRSHTRIVFEADPVVYLPPRFLGYEHIPGGCAIILRLGRNHKNLPYKFAAHRMVMYQSQLRLLHH